MMSGRTIRPTRADLLQLIWQSGSLPSGTPTVTSSVTSPLVAYGGALNSLTRCDKYTHDMGASQVFNSHLHVSSATPLSVLAFVCQGHNLIGETGVYAVVQELLTQGCDVMLMALPGYGENTGEGDHNILGATETAELCPLKYFVEPHVVALNSLNASYSHIVCIGISGGGWTTTLLAAVDTRVDLSIPVSGSLPWRLLQNYGDWEQARINSAGIDYEHLYLLGCDAVGRKQVQVLNPNDSAAFARTNPYSGAYGTDYGTSVVARIDAAAVGTFEWQEDTTIPDQHAISAWCLSDVIVPEILAL